MTAADPTPRDRLLSFRITLDTAQGEISYEDVATGPRAKEAAVLSTVPLPAAVADNDLGDPGIRGVRLRFDSSTRERRLSLIKQLVDQGHAGAAGAQMGQIMAQRFDAFAHARLRVLLDGVEHDGATRGAW